jgi:hypothetical protein
MEVALSIVPGPYGRYRKLSNGDKNVSEMVEGYERYCG